MSYPKKIKDAVKLITELFPKAYILKGREKKMYERNESRDNLKFECRCLWELDRKNLKNGNSQRLQIEQWEVNGKLVGSPRLALREYYLDKAGEDKAGKAKGLGYDELKTIITNMNKVEDALLGRINVKPLVSPKDQYGQTDDIPW